MNGCIWKRKQKNQTAFLQSDVALAWPAIEIQFYSRPLKPPTYTEWSRVRFYVMSHPKALSDTIETIQDGNCIAINTMLFRLNQQQSSAIVPPPLHTILAA